MKMLPAEEDDEDEAVKERQLIQFKFRSVLQYGDCITVIGTVQRKSRFHLRLKSDFLMLRPQGDESLFVQDLEELGDEETLPLQETTPLEICLNTSGEWDVISQTPQATSSASGFSARRFGFCAGQLFVCKILIRVDHYEVFINDYRLSLSEHLVPLGFVNKILVTGQVQLHAMLFGRAFAVQEIAQFLLNKQSLEDEQFCILECSTRNDKLHFVNHEREQQEIALPRLQFCQEHEQEEQQPTLDQDLVLGLTNLQRLQTRAKLLQAQPAGLQNRPVSLDLNATPIVHELEENKDDAELSTAISLDWSRVWISDEMLLKHCCAQQEQTVNFAPSLVFDEGDSIRQACTSLNLAGCSLQSSVLHQASNEELTMNSTLESLCSDLISIGEERCCFTDLDTPVPTTATRLQQQGVLFPWQVPSLVLKPLMLRCLSQESLVSVSPLNNDSEVSSINSGDLRQQQQLHNEAGEEDEDSSSLKQRAAKWFKRRIFRSTKI